MARFTQQQRNKARERFLAEHPEIKRHIDSITDEYAKNCNSSLEDCRSLETMLAIDDYAEKNGLDDHELFLHYIADSAEEFQRLLAEWRAMIADIDPLKFPAS
ncbi:DUF6388 family protein [Herbaspirillum huttiense]|uniref:DUF6388 family protein n=1 Tax=Herbaspirillum huttiense TaxID=863372 RepID=UPI0039AEA970